MNRGESAMLSGGTEQPVGSGLAGPIGPTFANEPSLNPRTHKYLFELLFEAFCGAVVVLCLVSLQLSYKFNLLSQLNAEILEYGAYILLGLVLIRFSDRIIKVRGVRSILLAALASMLVSAVLNLSNNISAVDAWPLLGAQSRLNYPVKYAFEISAIFLMFAAIYSAIVALRSASDALKAGQAQLLAENSLRRDIEQGLRHSEEKYRSLFDNSAVGVLIVNRDGLILNMNRTMAGLLGRRIERGDATSFWQMIRSPADRDKLLDVMEREGIVNGLECEIACGETAMRWLSVSATSLTYESVPAYQITAFDITRRRRAEAEKADLEGQYRQAQKMEAIGQLTGGIAHDFNNLLQVINWGIETASNAIPVAHAAAGPLENASKASERACRLVSQLLLFSRRQIMQPKPLDMNEAIAGLLKMIGRIIGEHINLRWHPGKGIDVVNADLGMIEQALMNLCINARDAMPDGGDLTISTANIEMNENNWPDITPVRQGKFVVVTVEDNGCGMSPATRARVFEPFFTTKEQGKGTGLGLSTVYGILQQHGGTVHVYSELGKGSVFKLYWPAVSSARAEENPVEPSPVPLGTETILLAEDDELVRGMTQSLLESAGYRVLSVTNGAEAVALFKTRTEEIDMVLLDVVMPKMGGRAAYEQITGIRPEAKTLFASGYSPDAIHTNFVLDANLRLIRKPFRRDELLFAVREVLDNAVSTLV